ncbi:hypothetical protein BDP27DRAFT_1371712 [Rhodocollybia butyracea]|uniref:Uncharacterized protein n=1 Tax=Rhodocollybia butyracea TaxID=206335 RepID=A0A9P5TYH2_9AGAR|nr:hypothetical protein BDP27DRAFT_1371712 [Rhodocollybia butyracea]
MRSFTSKIQLLLRKCASGYIGDSLALCKNKFGLVGDLGEVGNFTDLDKVCISRKNPLKSHRRYFKNGQTGTASKFGRPTSVTHCYVAEFHMNEIITNKVPNYTLQLKSHYRIPSLALKLEMNCTKSTSNQQDMVPLIPQSDPSRLDRDTADDTNINRRILMVWMVLEPIVGNWIHEGTGSIVVFANACTKLKEGGKITPPFVASTNAANEGVAGSMTHHHLRLTGSTS